MSLITTEFRTSKGKNLYNCPQQHLSQEIRCGRNPSVYGKTDKKSKYSPYKLWIDSHKKEGYSGACFNIHENLEAITK